MDKQINKLRPGQEIELSRSGNKRVTVERSGDGKVIRFVRYEGDSWRVFRTREF